MKLTFLRSKFSSARGVLVAGVLKVKVFTLGLGDLWAWVSHFVGVNKMVWPCPLFPLLPKDWDPSPASGLELMIVASGFSYRRLR